MSRLMSFLLSRGLWSFFGLLALALLIWVMGPMIAIGASRPLEQPWARGVLIGLIFLVWLLRWMWRKWREGRLNARLLGQLRRPSPKEVSGPNDERPADEIRELENRFSEALD